MLQDGVSWMAVIKEGPYSQPQISGGDRREKVPWGEGGRCTCARLAASAFSFSKEKGKFIFKCLGKENSRLQQVQK